MFLVRTLKVCNQSGPGYGESGPDCGGESELFKP